MTTMARVVENAGFVSLGADPADGRASRVCLTSKARRFQPVAERVLSEIEARVLRESNPSDLKAVRRWLATFTGSPIGK